MSQVIRKTLVVTSTVICIGFELLRHVVALLAGTPEPTAQEDALNSAIRGGDLNQRTGRFDDGSDPSGWYEHN